MEQLPPGLTPDMLSAAVNFILQNQMAVAANRPTGLLEPSQIRGVNKNYRYVFREYPKALSPPPVMVSSASDERAFRQKNGMPLPYTGETADRFTADYYAFQDYPKRMFPPQVIVQSKEDEAAKLAAWRIRTVPKAGGVTYPKWFFHADKGAVMVDDRDAEIALGGGWFATPAEAMGATRAEPVEAVSPVPAVMDAEDDETPPVAFVADERQPLFERAADLGIDIDRRWGPARLTAEIDRAEAEIRLAGVDA